MKRRARARGLDRRLDALVAAALVLGLTSTALLLTRFPTWPWPGGDAFYYASITEALVEGGSLDLREWPPALKRSSEEVLIHHSDGSIYTIFPLGLPIVQLPVFAIGRSISKRLDDPNAQLLVETLAFGFTPAILYGLTAGVLFLLLRRYFRFPVPWSLLGVGLYCTATLAFSFSRHNGVEPLQTFLLAWMLYSLLLPGPWSSPIAAFSFGLSVLTKPPTAVLLPVASYLYLVKRVWQKSPWTSRVLAVAIAIGLAGVFFWYNAMRGGNPLSAYPTSQGAGTFGLGKLWATLWPALLGPDRNVFLNNPVFFLALPGLFLLRDRTYLISAMGCWAAYLLLYGTSGNANWGSYVGNCRYLVPLGFLLVPFALATIRWVVDAKPAALRIPLLVGVVAIALSSFYVQLLWASFSEFHVKHYERYYNRIVRQGAGEQLGIAEIEETRHSLRFAHQLFWLTSGTRPEGLEAFPYPSREPETAKFAAAFLSGTFSDRWFRKDFLFLNRSAFPDVGFFGALRALLALAALSGLAATGLLAARAHAADPCSANGQAAGPEQPGH